MRALRAAALTQLAVYAALVALFANLPAGYNGKVGFDLGGLAAFRRILPYPALELSPATFTIVGEVLILALWALLGVAVRAADEIDERTAPAAARAVLVASLAQHALLVVWCPPVLSRDLYLYAAFGKMVRAGLNPYTTALASLPTDPVSSLADWQSLGSHYGAFFTWISAGMTVLGGDSPLRTAWAFKGLAAAANVAAALLAWRLARQRSPREGLVTLVLGALAPLFVLESAGSGHNEALMMALALGGLWWWRRRRFALASAALTLSVLVKFVTAALPLLLLASELARPAPGTRRARLLATVLGVSTALALALYLPFGVGPSHWGLGASQSLIAQGHALTGGPAPELVGLRLAVFGLAVVAALVITVRWPVASDVELAAVLSLLFVAVVFQWRFCWYLVPGATLVSVAAPSPTRSPLRLLTFAIAFGWSLLYPMLLRV
jgi:MYXO-CTERM domain-containing protein